MKQSSRGHFRGNDREQGRGGLRGARAHGRGHRGHHGSDGHHEIRRLLAHGDLRFVVLALIEEKPRHGYELIKQIETKSSGQYAPSPGVIYPTLTYLEETGLVKTTLLDEKKQYSITKEGSVLLGENREFAKGILQRLESMGAKLASAKADSGEESFGDHDRSEIKLAFHAIRHELRSLAPLSAKMKIEVLKILEKTRIEIQKLGPKAE